MPPYYERSPLRETVNILVRSGVDYAKKFGHFILRMPHQLASHGDHNFEHPPEPDDESWMDVYLPDGHYRASSRDFEARLPEDDRYYRGE